MTVVATQTSSADSEWRSLTAAVVAGLAGAMVFVLAPMFLAALRRDPLGLTENQIGLIGSADPTGLFIGAALGLVVIHRMSRRMLAVSALAAVAAINLLCIALIPSFTLLLALRVLAGTAGGLVLAVAYVGMGATRVPDRSYACFLIAQTLVGAMLISGLARWVPNAGMRSVFAAGASLSLLAMAVAPWLSLGPDQAEAARSRVPFPGVLTVLTASAISLIGAACLAIWVNFESYGEIMGLSHVAISTAVSLGLFGAAAGSTLVALTGHRFGRIVPCALLMAILIASTLSLSLPLNATMFAITAFSFQFGISACNYVFGMINEADSGGGLAIVYLLSLKAGFAFGPWLGSRLIIAGGLNAIIAGSVLALVIVFILFVAILRRPKATSASPAERLA